MNPDTGKFYMIDDSSNPKKETIKTYTAKEKEWPIFEIGETIKIKGYPFELIYIKNSTGKVILKPKARAWEGVE